MLSYALPVLLLLLPATSASDPTPTPTASAPTDDSATAAKRVPCDLTGEWSGHWPARYSGGPAAGAAASVVKITANDVSAGEFTAFVAHWQPPHQALKLQPNGDLVLSSRPTATHGTARALNASEKACTFIEIHASGDDSWCLSPLCPIVAQPAPVPPPPAQAPSEPWAPLHGFDATALPAVPASIDPLVRYSWDPSVDRTKMQTYLNKPKAIVAAEPTSALTNLPSILGASPHVTLHPGATICLDFGLETAGWIEFGSPDLGSAGHAAAKDVSVSMGEYNSPCVHAP